MLDNTNQILLKTTGIILFAIGLALNICMIFFGFWPSWVYILLMLLGAGMIILARKINTRSLLPDITVKKIRKLLLTALIICVAVLGSILMIAFLSQDYLKKRNTINQSVEITKALELFKTNTKVYPVCLADIIGNNPLRYNWTKDGWGNNYKYITSHNQCGYTLVSAGKDGKFGSNDDIVFKAP